MFHTEVLLLMKYLYKTFKMENTHFGNPAQLFYQQFLSKLLKIHYFKVPLYYQIVKMLHN